MAELVFNFRLPVPKSGNSLFYKVIDTHEELSCLDVTANLFDPKIQPCGSLTSKEVVRRCELADPLSYWPPGLGQGRRGGESVFILQFPQLLLSTNMSQDLNWACLYQL